MINILGYVKHTSAAEMLAYEYYRLYLPLRELNRNSADIQATVINSEQMSQFCDDDLAGYDYFACSRLMAPRAIEFVGAIHARGAQIVYDCDDDLTDDVRWISGYGDLFKEILGLVDHVTVTTPALAEHLGQYTRRVPIVLPNYVDSEWMQQSSVNIRRFVPGLTVGFSGTWTHWNDWMNILDIDGIQPLVLGYCPPYLLDVPGIVKIEKVPFAGYPQMLSQFDVLLCMLETEESVGPYIWNHGKSSVKALEAMSLGIVALCSDTPAYRELYETGAPLVLVEDREDWPLKLKQIVEDPALRVSLSAAGPEWVAENRDMRNSGWENWERLYQGLE